MTKKYLDGVADLRNGLKDKGKMTWCSLVGQWNLWFVLAPFIINFKNIRILSSKKLLIPYQVRKFYIDRGIKKNLVLAKIKTVRTKMNEWDYYTPSITNLNMKSKFQTLIAPLCANSAILILVKILIFIV